MILFNSDRSGQLELYAKDLEGRITRKFTLDEGNQFNGPWRL